MAGINPDLGRPQDHPAGTGRTPRAGSTRRPRQALLRAAVGQYEAEHGAFIPEEIAEADEWAARVTQPPGTRRSA